MLQEDHNGLRRGIRLKSIEDIFCFIKYAITFAGSGRISKYRRRSFCLAAMLFRMTSTADNELKIIRHNSKAVAYSMLVRSPECSHRAEQSYFVG